MKPIHEILKRIRWDNQYAQRQFKIGYYDRVEDGIIRKPFELFCLILETILALR
ncbi:MAG: DUF504 domain-containing protein [Gammaproteobacteria bacterium]|nr:DUF504 domain-containing protein [Gammaproteobacteria bacterium]